MQTINVVKFIKAYHAMELNSIESTERVIKKIIDPDYLAHHLCNSWEGRKKDFGDFYLNLSHHTQYKFLKFWGLHNEEAEAYTKKVEENAMAAIFLETPDAILYPHQLLIFFYNHGIDPECEMPYVVLSKLPQEKFRYGNSYNWAEYLLNLSDKERDEVILQIVKFIKTKFK